MLLMGPITVSCCTPAGLKAAVRRTNLLAAHGLLPDNRLGVPPSHRLIRARAAESCTGRAGPILREARLRYRVWTRLANKTRLPAEGFLDHYFLDCCFPT